MSDASGRDDGAAASDDAAGLDGSPRVEPLWREALGRRLREARRRQGRTLAGTARRAGISTQYLSEVERGRKDASSEIIAAIAGALGYSLGEMAGMAARDLMALGRPALSVGPRIHLVRPIGTGLAQSEDGGPLSPGPTGPFALAGGSRLSGPVARAA